MSKAWRTMWFPRTLNETQELRIKLSESEGNWINQGMVSSRWHHSFAGIAEFLNLMQELRIKLMESEENWINQGMVSSRWQIKGTK